MCGVAYDDKPYSQPQGLKLERHLRFQKACKISIVFEDLSEFGLFWAFQIVYTEKPFSCKISRIYQGLIEDLSRIQSFWNRK